MLLYYACMYFLMRYYWGQKVGPGRDRDVGYAVQCLPEHRSTVYRVQAVLSGEMSRLHAARRILPEVSACAGDTSLKSSGDITHSGALDLSCAARRLIQHSDPGQRDAKTFPQHRPYGDHYRQLAI